jgi:TPR repeat protein
MLSCKFVDRFWERFWEHSDAWEREASNDIELWAQESDRNRELIDRAIAVEKTDPAAAFRLYLEAAEEGSVWSMQRVGWHYWTGVGVAADLGRAQEYYHRASCAGSWIATLHYARLLAKHGHYDDCESVLKDGVAADFVPAYFWLARFRYKRSKTRKSCREVRPLLEYAAGKGHPAAAQMLARWMLFGKFGLREILRGAGAGWKLPIQWAFEEEERDLRG